MAKKLDLFDYLQQKGSPLAAHVDAIYKYANKYRIDPRLIVAIAGAESSFGQHLSGSFNAWGIGPGRSYGSWPGGIQAAAKLLREGYVGQGLKTIPAIQQKWAPNAAANDPTGLNSNWTRNVSAFYSELGGNPGKANTNFMVEASPSLIDNLRADDVMLSEATSLAPEPQFSLLDVATGKVRATDYLRDRASSTPWPMDIPKAPVQTPELPSMPGMPQMNGSGPGVSGGQLEPMKRLNPAMQKIATQYGLEITSGYRSLAEQQQIYSQGGVAAQPGKSYHNFGRAIDVAPNQAAMRFVEYARKNPGLFREVFFDIGRHSIYIKNGKLYPGRILGGHDDHVHIAR